MWPPAGTSITNETLPVVAKSSGPSGVPSGLLPKASAAAASAGSNERSGLRGENRTGIHRVVRRSGHVAARRRRQARRVRPVRRA